MAADGFEAERPTGSSGQLSVTSPSDSWLFDHYRADLWSVSEPQPFGMAVPERSWAAEDYRFGFNGKENDGEWGAQDYGMRIHSGSVCLSAPRRRDAQLLANAAAEQVVQLLVSPDGRLLTGGRIEPDAVLRAFAQQYATLSH